MRSGFVDTVQAIYNIFDQSPEDELLPAVDAAGVGLIVRVPFDEGALTGAIRPDTTFPDGDFRNAYFTPDRREEVWRRVEAIAADASVQPDGLAGSALRFCLSQPAVSTVIPGMRSARNVERNVAASESRPTVRGGCWPTCGTHRWGPRNFYL